MSEQRLSDPPLADLREGDSFEGFYVVRESSLNTAVNGKHYIRMTLADASASVGANVWDANPELFQLCPPNSIVKVQGAGEVYRGRMQLRITRFRPAHESEVSIERFLPKTSKDADAMRKELLDLVDSIRDPDYKALAEAFFSDRKMLDDFTRAPAAREVHHAWIGGLLEHTLSLARLAECFAGEGGVDRDLLLVGALLHDIGKTEELSVGLSIEYSDRGKLLGHLYIGSEMAAKRAAAIPGFPRIKLELVQHLILSHHGRHEYGSPVLPKIPEAFALHHIDNLDAKVVTANRLIDAIPDQEKNWTEFSRTLETALFRAGPAKGGSKHGGH